MEHTTPVSSLFDAVRRALVLAGTGAAAGAVCLAAAVAWHPAVVWEADGDLPRVTSGFYPVERNGIDTFAWTGRTAAFRLTGVDRHVEWQCAVRVRGGRAAGTEQPVVEIGVDGLTLATRTATNDYQDIQVTIPPRASPGLTLSIASSSVVVPGASDTRQLGVQIDRVRCQPVRGMARPPARTWIAATASGAIFGAAFALLGAGLAPGMIGLLLLAIAQAVPLSAGPAPYTSYAGTPVFLAWWIALPLAVTAAVIRGRHWRPIPPAAQWALAFSAVALFLQLLALLHPLKAAVDVVFHAHRLDAVLAGHYYFTQPMPSGVQFPYAIALYLFAAPWTAVIRDHVVLLRVVVSCTHVLAGLLLYPMIVRWWRDRTAAVLAVMLYQFVPLPYIVIGNANLTYVFGQSFAVFTVVGAASWPFASRRLLQFGGLFVLASVAYLSHVGVFPVLLTTLVFLAVFCWWIGGPDQRTPARYILLATLLAAVFSVVSYYGRFGDAYSTLQRVRARATVADSVTPAGKDAGMPEAAPEPGLPLSQRVWRAARILAQDAGWPVLLLAMAGAWRVGTVRTRERLRLWLFGAALTHLAFLAFAVAAPVEPRFQRYTDEFVSRLDFATLPAIVVLGAWGAAWAWGKGTGPYLAAVALLGAAAVLGAQRWLQWFV